MSSENTDKPNDEKSNRLKSALDTLRQLGFETPPVEAEVVTGAFGITPDGVNGVPILGEVLHKAWMMARINGAPVEMLQRFAAQTLGSFALSMAHSFFELDDEVTPLSLMSGYMNQTREEQASLAADLCRMVAERLDMFSQVTEEELAEMRKENDSEPDLIDKEAAEQLRKLFESGTADKDD